MEFFPEPYRTALAFLLVLGILIFVHELGHYLAARWRGVHVERFSVGFGHTIASWTDRRGTEWRMGWVPLGGYVRLHGQDPGDAARSPNPIPNGTFHDKPVLDRAIIVAGGPIANMVLAAFLFAVVFASNGRPYASPIVVQVTEGSPAAAGGLLVGDRVLSMAGMPTPAFDVVQRLIRSHPGVPVPMSVMREGQMLSMTVIPEARDRDGRPYGYLGVSGGVTAFEKVPMPNALWDGAGFAFVAAGKVAEGLWEMASGQRTTAEIGGPLRIAQMSGETAAGGFIVFLGFMGFLSVNLALVNMLPVPALDGGHLFCYLVEAIRGRPLPPHVLEFGLRCGVAALLGLMVFAMWNDLTHLGVFAWLAS